ncbi:MAG: acetyltransferase [Scytonema sp. RU_4_4]|nr:acetyltransferase [Scytonema sp. RU_4_4]
MFLQHIPTQSLIEVLNVQALWDPFMSEVLGQSHSGEEMQDAETYSKMELTFPSGEPLPQCWINPHYRDKMLNTQAKPLIVMQ